MIFHIQFPTNLNQLKHKRMMTPVNFFKSLSDDTRLRCILLIQHEKELCVCELMAAIEESQPKISRHLAQLRKSGVLTDRRQGQWIYYQINPDLADWAKLIISQTLSSNLGFISSNIHNLNTMGDRPERNKSCCS
jgi:ArsR family transcriptional regulator